MDQEELKRNHRKAAGRRFKYLLRQSGMLEFFKGGLFEIDEEAVRSRRPNVLKKPLAQAELAAPEVPKGRSSARSRQAAKVAEDEVAADEEDDDNAQEKTEFLTRQPSCVVGGTMRSYQLEGLNWMIRLRSNGLNGILADEMGLGKTLQSISMLAYLHEFQNTSGPHLVLVPKTTLSNWLNEFARWLPGVRVVKFHGSKDERAETAQLLLAGVSHSLDANTASKKRRAERLASQHEGRTWDVVVSTYEVANLEKTTLTKLAWRMLIIDEAHRIKNENAQLSKTVRMLRVENRLLITGTPLQNNLHELWALLNFLLPDVFASSEKFDELFNLQIVDADAKRAIIEQLHKLLRPFVLRRLKHDVEKGLPPKSETILFTGMSATQRDVYKGCLLREIDVVQSNSTSGKQRTAVLNLAMQLRKCCNHPYLFPNVEDRSLPPLGEHLVDNCGKLVLLDKLLKRLKDKGHRVLVFSQMTRMLDILEDYMVMRGYEYCRIDGRTAHDLREAHIDNYNAPNSTKFVFLLSTRAGGLGVNLQTADTVVLYDSDWNPQADLQAMDRCHRIGQTKPVHVYRLVTEHSIEEKVVERAQQKLKLDAVVVQQGRLQEKSTKLATESLLQAVRFGADKVFRSSAEVVTEEDIDAIIERGHKKTAELEAKLASADKGDLLDFKLDGGMNVQTWEGVDYAGAGKNKSGQQGVPFVLDTGKRERKRTVYTELDEPEVSRKKRPRGGGSSNRGSSKYDDGDSSDDDSNDDGDDALLGVGKSRSGENRAPRERPPRLPQWLRMPAMEDWQLFENRDRMVEIANLEEERFVNFLKDNPEAKQEYLNSPRDFDIRRFNLSTEEEDREKYDAFRAAYPRWSKGDFTQFIKASARYGRDNYALISGELYKKPPEEVEKYSKDFWAKGERFLSAAEWDKCCRIVERGEKKLEELQPAWEATKKFVALWQPNARLELNFKFTNTNVGFPQFPGLESNPDEERVLLTLIVDHGWPNWKVVYQHYRAALELQFDWYSLNLDLDALVRRGEALMRCAEKEHAELERRWLAYKQAEETLAAARRGVPKNPDTGRPLSQAQRVARMFEKMLDDHRKQADLRNELKAAKGSASAKSNAAPSPSAKKIAGSTGPGDSGSTSSNAAGSGSAAKKVDNKVHHAPAPAPSSAKSGNDDDRDNGDNGEENKKKKPSSKVNDDDNGENKKKKKKKSSTSAAPPQSSADKSPPAVAPSETAVAAAAAAAKEFFRNPAGTPAAAVVDRGPAHDSSSGPQKQQQQQTAPSSIKAAMAPPRPAAAAAAPRAKKRPTRNRKEPALLPKSPSPSLGKSQGLL